MFFCYWWRFVWSNVPHVVLNWCKLSPKGPKLRNVAHDLDIHVHHMAAGVHLDRYGPNFKPTWPIGANLCSAGSKIGPSWAPPANFANSRRHAENLHVYRYLQGILALMRVRASYVAHIGLVSGPTSTPDAPTEDQVAHAKLTCAQPCPPVRPTLRPEQVWPQLACGWAK